MRKFQIVGTIVAIAFGAISPTKAANPEFIRQLLQTNGCPGCDLTDADLRDLDLTEADLSGANLTGADLSGVDLRGATLTDARLENTDLSYALMLDAEFPEASSTTWNGALRTADDISGLLDELTARVERTYRSQASKARESEAKNWIGAINRAQQAYRLENIDFAATLERLQVGLPSESDRYSYAIESQPEPGLSVMATARAKEEGLRSYTGAVFVIESLSISIICETDLPSMTPPEMPAPPRSASERPSCPTGSSEL